MIDMNWNSKKNGELLALMVANKFDVLLTFDQNIEHQQNFEIYSLAVIVLLAVNNTHQILSVLVPKIKTELGKPLWKGAVRISG